MERSVCERRERRGEVSVFGMVSVFWEEERSLIFLEMRSCLEAVEMRDIIGVSISMYGLGSSS